MGLIKMSNAIVVIGGVAAGMSAASKAKRVCPDAMVSVYTEEPYISYSACSLPYFAKNLITEESQLIARTPDQMKVRGVDVYTNCRVTAIHRDTKSITIENKDGHREDVNYDRLVIATGSKNIVPNIPNAKAKGVFTVKGIPDIHTIRAYIADNGCRKAVIIGGGFIGLEMADALFCLGMKTTVIEKAPQIMSILDEDIAGHISDYLVHSGLNIHCNTGVDGIVTDDNGKVCAVHTETGDFDADIVIMAIGLYADTQIAAEAGIELGFKKAIRVNERMETNIPNIYAAGDCAATKNLVTGQETWICLGTVANRNGKVAGENAAGGNAAYEGQIGTTVFKLLNKEAAKTGLSMREAKLAGIDAWDTVINSNTRASGYPGRGSIIVKLVVERDTNRLIGGQIFGDDGSAKRIDAIAAYVQLKQNVHSLAKLDMGYAPPFSPVWDPVLVAAAQAASKSYQIR